MNLLTTVLVIAVKTYQSSHFENRCLLWTPPQNPCLYRSIHSRRPPKATSTSVDIGSTSQQTAAAIESECVNAGENEFFPVVRSICSVCVFVGIAPVQLSQRCVQDPHIWIWYWFVGGSISSIPVPTGTASGPTVDIRPNLGINSAVIDVPFELSGFAREKYCSRLQQPYWSEFSAAGWRQPKQ
jgi:hypothetical protein